MTYETVKARRARNRATATEFVTQVNSVTYCEVCGAQPIEWHHDDHPNKPNSRVSSLRTQGISIARIKEEMDKCTPLCRLHHMALDGRLQALLEAAPFKQGVVYATPKPCTCCGRVTSTPRNGKCVTCDNHHSGRRRGKTDSCTGCTKLGLGEK